VLASQAPGDRVIRPGERAAGGFWYLAQAGVETNDAAQFG
jgi:hypothetical protein